VLVKIGSVKEIRVSEKYSITKTHDTISRAILTANLPTLVPPYFWTNHFASGSVVFWRRARRMVEEGESGKMLGSDSDSDIRHQLERKITGATSHG